MRYYSSPLPYSIQWVSPWTDSPDFVSERVDLESMAIEHIESGLVGGKYLAGAVDYGSAIASPTYATIAPIQYGEWWFVWFINPGTGVTGRRIVQYLGNQSWLFLNGVTVARLDPRYVLYAGIVSFTDPAQDDDGADADYANFVADKLPPMPSVIIGENSIDRLFGIARIFEKNNARRPYYLFFDGMPKGVSGEYVSPITPADIGSRMGKSVYLVDCSSSHVVDYLLLQHGAGALGNVIVATRTIGWLRRIKWANCEYSY